MKASYSEQLLTVKELTSNTGVKSVKITPFIYGICTLNFQSTRDCDNVYFSIKKQIRDKQMDLGFNFKRVFNNGNCKRIEVVF